MASELFNFIMTGFKEIAEYRGDYDLAADIENDRLSLNESLNDGANDYPTDINKLKARLREINKAIEHGEDPEYFAYEKKKIFDQLDSLGSNYYDESLDEAKNETLNQALWDDNNELKPEVRETLQKVADTFIHKLEEDDIPLDVKDLIIVGSNANYNYGPQSDVDLHIVADLSPYKGREKELLEKIYQAKKSIFNDKYDPTIRGFEVEIYVEPAEDKDMNRIPDEVEEPVEESLNEAVGDIKQWFIVKVPNGRLKDGRTKWYISVQMTNEPKEYDSQTIPREVSTWGAHNERLTKVPKDYIMGIFNDRDTAIQIAKSIIDANDNFFSDINESLNEAVDTGDCIEITPEKGLEIFDTREPRGKFWYKENQIFIAVDNTTGDAWTEDFKTLEDAINWLNRTDYEESPDPGSSFELDEDTVKQNGKWVNKGEEGTHGKFKTKKEADAQRKAMFANGYKESLDENSSKLNDYFDINEDVDANVERVRAILLDNGDYYDVYKKDGKVAVEIDWGDWKHDHIYLDNLLSEYGFIKVDEEETDEDGSDTYSSIHYFEDPDDYQVDETLELHIPSDDSEFEGSLEESDHRSSKDIAWDEFLKEKGYDSQEAYDDYLDSLDDDEFDKYVFGLRDEFDDYYIDWLDKEFKYDLDSKYPDEEDIPSFWEWIKQQGMDPDDIEDNPDLEDYYQQQYDITFNLKSPEDYRY